LKEKDVIKFFAELAPNWDDNPGKNSETVDRILNVAGVGKGKDVLDVACGTGVLIPEYLERGASSVTAIDITPEMTEIAKRKFQREDVEIICGDAAKTDFGKRFDSIVIYDAFPHFVDPEKLISHLAGCLKENGILTVAQGGSRERVNAHHKNVMHVSRQLMPAEELAEMFGKYLTVTAVISDENMYQVAGILGDLPDTGMIKNVKEGTVEMHDHHEHTHEHSHEHPHVHTHEDITAFESTEQAVRILGYMLDHNKSHAEELHEICHKLEASGEEEAAEYLDKAVDAFRDGNSLMEKALSSLKKEEE